jgi:hypothetical protein
LAAIGPRWRVVPYTHHDDPLVLWMRSRWTFWIIGLVCVRPFLFLSISRSSACLYL